MNPNYPIYIPSKGRHETRLTVKALGCRNIPYFIVIEPQEYEAYASVINPQNILTLPFSNLGQGSIPARNWIFEHSIRQGFSHHWVLDDNIRDFRYLTNNIKYITTSGTTFRIIEDWCNRYENIAMAGMQYDYFVPRKTADYPIIFNTRIYSIILINNSIPFRWRGKYNEDTDLSLRVLKDGWCTALFNAFPADKVETGTMSGGNATELYKNGRLEFALSLQQQHPDVVKVVRRYNRWHHQVDYRPFKGNKLIKRAGIETPQGINNYGMQLRENR